MSNYHILEQSEDKKTVRTVFHLPVPDYTTEAAVKLEASLVAAKDSESPVSQVPNLATDNPTEYAAIQAGKIYEHVEAVRYSSVNLTNSQRIAEIESRYKILAVDAIEPLKTRLDLFGKSADVTEVK